MSTNIRHRKFIQPLFYALFAFLKNRTSKLISSSDIQVWHNIMQPVKECKTITERQQKLKSVVNWQVALKQKGVKQTGIKQRFSVHHCKAIHLCKKYSQHPFQLSEECKDSC
jgi:hypothetical protein